MYARKTRPAFAAITLVIVIALILTPLPQVFAADHAESTSVTIDPGADLGDSFIFLNPSDNSKVVLAMTVAGFLPPTQALNHAFFSQDILYRFEIENTGDAIADLKIDVTFTAQTSRTAPQTAMVSVNGIRRNGGRPRTFTAPTTVPSLVTGPAPAFVVTTDSSTGIRFYAGLTDDPFYFDIAAFGRFVGSVLGGTPNADFLNRSRDSFAGYNIHTIALEVPASLLRGPAGEVLGMNAITMRRRNAVRQDSGEIVTSGDFVQVDRAAIPAVNTALIPFPRKNEFNAANTQDDANGRFAGSIVGTLTALGTSPANIGVLAQVAVVNGDFLRLNLEQPNNSIGFGERVTTPGYTGFPNGRRMGDDTIDVLMYFITNQALLMGDNVNSNEVPFTNTFPFFAPPHQPFAPGTIDDFTRN